ncbi:MAG: histidine phosphatase family protein [Ignavibacteria bacterium]|nr:histidine phosphatase family protein [Ignavibacteria bacterium]
MKIFLIRHAEAADIYSDRVLPDEYRFITPGGRKSAIKCAEKLKEHFSRTEIIYTSPLVRAVQTAEIFAVRLKFKGQVIAAEELLNESPVSSFQNLMNAADISGSAAFVGHEPKMSYLVKYLTGRRSLNFEFGKCGVCLIEYNNLKDTGEFKWYYNPKIREFVF